MSAVLPEKTDLPTCITCPVARFGRNNNAKLWPIDRPEGLDPEQEQRDLGAGPCMSVRVGPVQHLLLGNGGFSQCYPETNIPFDIHLVVQYRTSFVAFGTPRLVLYTH